jgi:hypothetical protein
VISFTLRTFTAEKGTPGIHWAGICAGRIVRIDDMGREYQPLLGIELHILVNTQPLYRLKEKKVQK